MVANGEGGTTAGWDSPINEIVKPTAKSGRLLPPNRNLPFNPKFLYQSRHLAGLTE